MVLKCEAFKNGGYIPEKYTGMGLDVSPALTWQDVPNGTESFVLIVDDPDAPSGSWAHWVVYEIPKNVNKLDEDIPREKVLGDGTKQGINSSRGIGYSGPIPPPGRPHRYFFILYALNGKLNLAPGAKKEAVEKAMEGLILDKTEIIGLFGR